MRRVSGGLVGTILMTVALIGNAHGQEPTPQEIVRAALSAHGGKEAMSQFKDRKSKGKGRFFQQGLEMRYVVTTWTKLPTAVAAEVSIYSPRDCKMERLLTEKQEWDRVDGKNSAMSDEKRRQVRHSLYLLDLALVYPLLEEGIRLRGAGRQTVKEKTVDAIIVSKKGEHDVSLYFDGDSHLLVMQSSEMFELPGKTEWNFYSEFKEFRGAMLPTELVTRFDDALYRESVITEIAPLEKSDEKRFTAP